MTIKNLLLLDLGIVTAFPLVLIPALTSLSADLNPHVSLRITAAEASWLGIKGASISFSARMEWLIVKYPNYE